MAAVAHVPKARCARTSLRPHTVSPRASARAMAMPPIPIAPGERIAQMLFVPVVRPVLAEVEAFSASTGRQGGFGSTGAT